MAKRIRFKKERDILLKSYCDWLNGMADPESPPYTVESLTVHEPKKDLYGSTTLISHYDSGFYRIFTWEIDSGDDGGPAVVTAWFEDSDLMHFLQEFDTEVDWGMKDGKLIWNTQNSIGEAKST